MKLFTRFKMSIPIEMEQIIYRVTTIKSMLISCAVLGTFTAFGLQGVLAEELSKALFSDIPYSEALHARMEQKQQDLTIVRGRYVQINFRNLVGEELYQGAESIVLNLFNNILLTAIRDRLETRESNSYTWFGRIEGIEYSQAILTVENGVMAGNIAFPGGFYQIRVIGEGVYAIFEIDQSAFPDELPPTPIEKTPDESADTAELMEDDGSIIDVMVVYTPAAAAASSSGINAEIQLAIDETNQSYTNSGITPRLNLVHTAQVDYTESGDLTTDRDQLQDPADNVMDNVHDLRDTYVADMVCLLVEYDSGICGIAYLMDPVSVSFENFGFQVTRRSCATGNYSFGHEFGHIQSARHDWYASDTVDSPHSYNHGYVYRPGMWYTMMAVKYECDDAGISCTRLQFWSNPDILMNGVPMGVDPGTDTSCTTGDLNNPDCDADNRLTLNNTAPTVANFRIKNIYVQWQNDCVNPNGRKYCSSGRGGPFTTVTDAVNASNIGNRLVIDSGSYNETLTIDKKMELSAWHGTVTIGQ